MTKVWRMDVKAWKIFEIRVEFVFLRLLLGQIFTLFSATLVSLSLCLPCSAYIGNVQRCQKDIMSKAVLEWIGRPSGVTLSAN